MKYNTPLALSLVLIVIGCKPHVEHAAPSMWSTLTIVSDENEVITIDNYDDTSTVKYYHTGTIFTPKPLKIKVDTLKTYFTMPEKDTLYNLVENIISTPITTKDQCVDFVGDLELTVDYGRFKEPGSFRQSASYSGVCNWDSLSDKTIELHRILKRKIKWGNK